MRIFIKRKARNKCPNIHTTCFTPKVFAKDSCRRPLREAPCPLMTEYRRRGTSEGAVPCVGGTELLIPDLDYVARVGNEAGTDGPDATHEAFR